MRGTKEGEEEGGGDEEGGEGQGEAGNIAADASSIWCTMEQSERSMSSCSHMPSATAASSGVRTP